MQTAEVVLGVLRERGRKGLPCEQGFVKVCVTVRDRQGQRKTAR